MSIQSLINYLSAVSFNPVKAPLTDRMAARLPMITGASPKAGH